MYYGVFFSFNIWYKRLDYIDVTLRVFKNGMHAIKSIWHELNYILIDEFVNVISFYVFSHSLEHFQEDRLSRNIHVYSILGLNQKRHNYEVNIILK